MNNKENRLSDYIDSLNEDRKPAEHDNDIQEEDMRELFETVRLVRSLREPELPSQGYSKALAEKLSGTLHTSKQSWGGKKRWFYGVAAAAILVIAFKFALPVGNDGIVHAMEKAYSQMKAYHGVLEIVETNEAGNTNVQSKLEIWADKQGHYYVKGLEGTQKDVITVNNGKDKWQIQPREKEVEVYSAFPDTYSFSFNLGKEIEEVKNAVKTKKLGEENIAGKTAQIIEVTPQGGSSYKIWIDEETKLPLQKQSSMENAIQYKLHYTSMDYMDSIPKELLAYSLPGDYKEVRVDLEEPVNTLEEVKEAVGFAPKLLNSMPDNYSQSSMRVSNSTKTFKMDFVSVSGEKKVSIYQGKATAAFKPAATAILGRVGESYAEIQAPVQSQEGILQGGDSYAGITGINSIRWQQDNFEYAVIGNTSVEELSDFIKVFTNENIILSADTEKDKPQIEVSVDLKAEEGDQKSTDAGHSAWKLDPVFTAQVYASLKLYPNGIQGDYPIKYEDLKTLKNNGKEAVVEIEDSKTIVKKVYLKKLIRQDSTGIWTVIGYDPAGSK